MEKLEQLAAETKFSVYSRRTTLIVTAGATVLIVCVLSLFAAVVVLKLHTCTGGLSPMSPQAIQEATKKICLDPGCLSAADYAVECKLLSWFVSENKSSEIFIVYFWSNAFNRKLQPFFVACS